jgi:hypothetical protein
MVWNVWGQFHMKKPLVAFGIPEQCFEKRRRDGEIITQAPFPEFPAFSSSEIIYDLSHRGVAAGAAGDDIDI